MVKSVTTYSYSMFRLLVALWVDVATTDQVNWFSSLS